jgi:peptide chain release factor 2
MRSGCGFDYDRKTRSLSELEKKTHAESFWNDQATAQKTMKEIADLRAEVDQIAGIGRSLEEARETLEVLGDEAGAAQEVDALLAGAERELAQLEMAATFDREYDAHGAIVTIHAGAGGIDAADWTQMLSRMLDSERGVHRLVRISPFDQQHRRHTSFAQVDVLPEIESDEQIDIEIKPEDLRVETFKSGGAGGQYVNKTESAIRITHLPSGIVVASQQERSQMQNRDVAMNILRAKLVQRESEEREAKLAEVRGERRANEWGSQIRSYVLQPYTLVKDHRTNVETGNVQAVLDGQIDTFIWPYLQQRGRAVAVGGRS